MKQGMKRINGKSLLAGALLTAFAATGPALAAEPSVDDFNTAFAKANDTRKMAAELGHEWRDTAKILKSAQETAVAGQLSEAMELVAQAQQQADQGIVQAEREETLWLGRIIR